MTTKNSMLSIYCVCLPENLKHTYCRPNFCTSPADAAAAMFSAAGRKRSCLSFWFLLSGLLVIHFPRSSVLISFYCKNVQGSSMLQIDVFYVYRIVEYCKTDVWLVALGFQSSVAPY